jgi:hypothetical protein
MTEAGFDAAYPPTAGPSPNTNKVVALYIGGDTPHVATLAQWNAQPQRYRLPIFTRSNPASNDPHVDSAAAIAKLKAIGCPPSGRLTLLDYETAVNAAHLTAYDSDMVAAGYLVMVYGSKDTVFRNPKPSGGYMAADWTGAPHMVPGSAATQYDDTGGSGAWDDDEFLASLPFWSTAPAAVRSLLSLEAEELRQIDSLAVKPDGEYAYQLGGLTGTVSAVGFGIDGFGATASLRVVVWDGSGRYEKVVAVGPGSAKDVGLPAQHKAAVAFVNPATTYLVTVTRLDKSPHPVGVGFS